MTTPAETIVGWKSSTEAHPREVMFRPLVEFDSWMPPVVDDFQGNAFGAIDEAMLQLKAHEGLWARPLVSCWDALEAYNAKFGASNYGDRGGWEIFCTEWKDAQALWIDPGTPQELLIEAEDFPKLQALAKAVAVERAWKRLHKGGEQPGDLALVVGYEGYHLAVVQDPDGVRVINVPHDDGRMFIPIFTHADALAQAMPEFERDFGEALRTIQVPGYKLFPPLVQENATGLVLNHLGPAEPLAFGLGIIEVLLEEIAKTAPTEAAPAPTTPPPLPKGPPPLPTAPKSAGPPPLPADPAVVDEVARLSNEGVELTQTTNAEDAETLLRRALALAEEKLGADHPSTAVCLNNLGDFLSQNRRFEEAEPVLRRAVEAKEKLHGADALETATALNNLALVLRRMEWFAEAESLYRRVLPIFEQGHGAESIEVASVLNNLAQILTHTDRSVAAEPLMRRVIELFETNFGPDHPNVAIALNNLARLLEDTGRPAEAEPLARRHLRIFQVFENETGNRHAYKESAISNYGDLLMRLGLDRQFAQRRINDLLRGGEVRDLRLDPPADKTAPTGETPDFDRLSAVANDAGASMSDQNALFGAAFRLAEWHFIARGELPNVRPYVAANPTIVSGAPMVKAFTDTDRLHAFAKENGLTGPEGEAQILSMSVATLLPTMADLAEQGVTHIHFNADMNSYGFYVPLVQLPIIRAHLEKHGLL